MPDYKPTENIAVEDMTDFIIFLKKLSYKCDKIYLILLQLCET